MLICEQARKQALMLYLGASMLGVCVCWFTRLPFSVFARLQRFGEGESIGRECERSVDKQDGLCEVSARRPESSLRVMRTISDLEGGGRSGGTNRPAAIRTAPPKGCSNLACGLRRRACPRSLATARSEPAERRPKVQERAGKPSSHAPLVSPGDTSGEPTF